MRRRSVVGASSSTTMAMTSSLFGLALSIRYRR
jgi:hypothetical protein